MDTVIRPEPSAPEDAHHDPGTLAAVGLGVAGGLLLALSLPPWPLSRGAWPLALVGAACLFVALEGRRPGGRVGVGLVAGLVFYLPALWWMRDFSLPGFLATVALEAVILAIALALVPASGLVRIVAFPSALVAAEAVRGAFPFGGLPLAGIDLGQADGPLAAASRLGGRLLVVGVVGLAGAGLAMLVKGAFRTARGSRVAPVVGGLAGVGLAAVLAAAGAVAPAGRESGRIEAAAVQGGGPRGLRAVDGDPADVLAAQVRASAVLRLDLDLVLWPEDVVDTDGALAGSDQEEALSSLATRLRTTLVAGVVEDVGANRFLNAAVAWGPDGQVVARYDKVHRVPFGEYVPARTFFDRLADLSDVPRDAIAGRGVGVLDTGAGTFGVLVSYEVFFEDRARAAVRADAAILLVPTNASSYRDAQVPAQEVAAARLRAIQTGRWVLQAAPTGYSVVVDHDGRVLQSSPLGLPAVLEGVVQLRTGDTPWTVIGSVPVMAAAGLGLLWGLLVARRQKRAPSSNRGDVGAYSATEPPQFGGEGGTSELGRPSGA